MVALSLCKPFQVPWAELKAGPMTGRDPRRVGQRQWNLDLGVSIAPRPSSVKSPLPNHKALDGQDCWLGQGGN